MRLHTPRQCRFANAAPSVSLFILFILFILCILFILSACMHGRRATPRPDPPRLLQRRLLRLMLLLLFLCKHVLKLLGFFQQHTRAAAVLAALVFGFSCVHRNDNTCVHVCMRA